MEYHSSRPLQRAECNIMAKRERAEPQYWQSEAMAKTLMSRYRLTLKSIEYSVLCWRWDDSYTDFELHKSVLHMFF